MFIVVLVGLSGFAAAVLKIETPETLSTEFGPPMTMARARSRHELLDEIRKVTAGTSRALDRADDALGRAIRENNPEPQASNFNPVEPIQVTQIEEAASDLKAGCDKLGDIVDKLKDDYPEIQLSDDVARRPAACRTLLARLNSDIARAQQRRP